MTKYRVFLGALPASDFSLDFIADASQYQWQTVSSNSQTSQSFLIGSIALEAASRRISLLYQNILFKEDKDEEVEPQAQAGGAVDVTENTRMSLDITWLATADEDPPGLFLSGKEAAVTPLEKTFERSSFLHSNLSSDYSLAQTDVTDSLDYSAGSAGESIAHFPAFNFTLHSLVSLSALSSSWGPRNVSVLLAVLEVEGPDKIRIKKGVDAGKEVSILKMILGDEDGNICKLTAWREVADAWGSGEGVKRGDVVYIENVTPAYDPQATSLTLTASSYLKSKLEICYRTMPCTHEDNRLRPDLRLGASDAAVRKVAMVVNWFEGIAGL